MMTALVVYITVGLVLGALAAWAEIRGVLSERERADGHGTFKSPPYSAIGIGLFVAVFWPLSLIAMAT